MNKRIKELAEQAGLDLIHGHFMTAPQEKFAQLIVRDVLNTITKIDSHCEYAQQNPQILVDQHRNATVAARGILAVTKSWIQEHFGVKE